MLTLQEVKQKVAIPEGRESVPTARHLRNLDAVFINRNLGADAEIMVYQSGYAVYRIGRYATVFSVHACGDYQYPVAGEILYIRENFFNLQEWYVRLVLEGEDRVFCNREAQEQEKSISYSAIAEDCIFMDGLGKSPLEQVIRQETIRELLEPLTERQRLIIGQYFLDRKAQKEIAHELGITAPLVSKTIAQAIRKIQKGYAELHSNIQKKEEGIKKGENPVRGKRPKERKSYVLRMSDGTLVEVTREVYLEWYQSRRREKYQEKRNRKNGVCSLEQLEEKAGDVTSVGDSLEETAIRKMCIEKLREVIDNLPEMDTYLLYLLFFEEVTVKEVAQLCGCSRKTVENRRRRILREVKSMLTT